MTEFLNTLPKGNVQIGMALIFMLIIFVIVFALTFVPNPKDHHRNRSARKQKQQRDNIVSRHSAIRDINAPDEFRRNRRR